MRRTRLVIAIFVLALVAIGLVVLASAGTTVAERFKVGATHFVVNQVKWLVLGVVAMATAYFFDYRQWREKPWLAWAFYGAVVAAMLAVFAFPSVNGSRRWIVFGSMRFQPGEFAKLACVIVTAVWLELADWKTRLFWKGIVPPCGFVGVLLALALAEPDYGTLFVIAMTFGAMLLVGGVKILHLVSLGVSGFVAVSPFLLSNANRMRRIFAWLPESALEKLAPYMPGIGEMSAADAQEANHQLNQALLAIQKGGVGGVGFNQSIQKHSYLPENHTDFIFAIGAEEWGIGFSFLVLALFTGIFVFGFYVALQAKDRLGRLLAFGVSFLIFFQALFNMAVVSGLAPTKGIALPFMSYGGTSLLSSLISVGVLLGVARQTSLQSFREKSKMSAVFSN